MPKKIIYGLNHEVYEDMLTKAIEEAGVDAIVLKTVTYREAVLSVLPGSGADVLIFRDTLEGTMDTAKLLEQVRMDYPKVQIILVCSVDPSSPLLAKCASLGIYDVINSDAVSPRDIVEHILHPGTFRDVYQYYNFSSPDMIPTDVREQKEAAAAAEPRRPRRGLFGIFGHGGGESEKPAAETGNTALVVPEGEKPADTPALNQQLVRETIEESATRRAQKDMDALIQKAVEEKTSEYLEKYEALESEISDNHHLISQKESEISALMQELSDEKSANAALTREYELEKERHQSDLSTYETQLAALQSKAETPQWYTEQEQKWENERSSLETELASVRAELLESTAKLEAAEAAGGEPGCAVDASELQAELEALRLRVPVLEQEKAELEKVAAVGSNIETERRLMESMQESDSLRTQLEDSRRAEAELRSNYDRQLSAVKAENEDFRRRLGVLDTEASLAPEIPRIPDEDTAVVSSGPSKTYVVLGAKHGVGNSTVAMNLASSFAAAGHKTILVEMNDSFPLTNEFFELNVSVGLFDALRAAGANNSTAVAPAIVRLNSARPVNKGVAGAYEKIPASLHILTSSNKELVSRGRGVQHKTDASQIRNLVQMLREEFGYSRIVFDIQPDDGNTLESLVKSEIRVDRLIVTVSQDPHGVGSAGVLISNLSGWRASEMLATAVFAVTRYDAAVRLTTAKIAAYLGLDESRFLVFSDDNAGYIEAAADGVPYALHGGRFAAEYEALCSRCGDVRPAQD